MAYGQIGNPYGLNQGSRVELEHPDTDVKTRKTSGFLVHMELIS